MGEGRLAQRSLTAIGAHFIGRVAGSSALFHYARLPAYWGTMSRLARALDLQPGERLLDVGCGTGIGAGLTRGMYVGVDTDTTYVRFAQAHRRRPTRSFVRMSALDLGFRAGAFDKAVLINMVHHLDGAVLERLLAQLIGVVRRKVVVVDAAPDTANRVSGFLLAHDRGHHVRTRRDLRALLERRYQIEREETFHNTLRYVSQVLFVLVPKRDDGPGVP